MAKEIQYSYCYDEHDNIVHISNITPQNKHDHKYKCINCGEEMIANTGEVKRHYFSHAKNTRCSGESYLHKLAKKLIKQKFENDERFNISYNIEINCNQEECFYKHLSCSRYIERKIDLKKYYDTCLEEAPIKGFIADLLLINSKKPEVEPILIEINVSHPCEEEKRKSKLKIIELSINSENDIIQLKEAKVIRETEPYEKKINKIEFISFIHTHDKRLIEPVLRYVSLPTNIYPYSCFVNVDCNDAEYKLRNDSDLELNIAENPFFSDNQYMIDLWLWKNKQIRSCSVCKYWGTIRYGDSKPICRIRNKYGHPQLRTTKDIDNCKYFAVEEIRFLMFNKESYKIKIVDSVNPRSKPEFKLILIISKRFSSYHIFKEKLLYYLSNKLLSHSIVLKYMKTSKCDEYLSNLSKDSDFPYIKESYLYESYNYTTNVINVINDEMMQTADALMIFADNESPQIKSAIDKAKKKQIPCVLVNDVQHGLK